MDTTQRLRLVLFAIPLIAVAALTVAAVRPHTTGGAVIDPTCTSSSPCIEYDNDGSGPGIRGVSIDGNGLAGSTEFKSTSTTNFREGLIGNDISTSGTFDAGVLGLSVRGAGVRGNSTSGTGVQGTSTNGYGVMATSTNTSALFVENMGSQDGVQAIALANDGTNSSTQNKSGGISGVGRSGVWGHDDSTDGGTLNVGVEGSSIHGVGVQGNSTSNVAVKAASTSGFGVSAASTSNYGLSASSVDSDGIYTTSTDSNGIESRTYNKSYVNGYGRSGVSGHDESTDGGSLNHGVSGDSNYGIGVEGNSAYWVGVNAIGGGYRSDVGEVPALSVIGDIVDCGTGCSFPAALIEACPAGTANVCSTASDVFELFQDGSLTISGEITTTGSCKTGCTAHNSLKQGVRFYTPRESLPTVEDFGEAQLVGGRSYVRIDPAFADTMDQHANYIVSITPEGPSHGLYVTAKTIAGFEVLENPGGQSTLAFSYRIVAKPYGENAPRLQRFAIHVPSPSRGRVNHLNPLR